MAEPATVNAISAVDAVEPIVRGPGDLAGPRGGRPKRAFSRHNVFLYGALILISIYYLVPLWVMLTTSFKTMDEVRQGNIFALPQDFTIFPWIKAWAQACTGINCDGLSRGFWNSVQILVPSVLVSIAVASVSGYALSLWRFKGSEA